MKESRRDKVVDRIFKLGKNIDELIIWIGLSLLFIWCLFDRIQFEEGDE